MDEEEEGAAKEREGRERKRERERDGSQNFGAVLQDHTAVRNSKDSTDLHLLRARRLDLDWTQPLLRRRAGRARPSLHHP